MNWLPLGARISPVSIICRTKICRYLKGGESSTKVMVSSRRPKIRDLFFIPTRKIIPLHLSVDFIHLNCVPSPCAPPVPTPPQKGAPNYPYPTPYPTQALTRTPTHMHSFCSGLETPVRPILFVPFILQPDKRKGSDRKLKSHSFICGCFTCTLAFQSSSWL